MRKVIHKFIQAFLIFLFLFLLLTPLHVVPPIAKRISTHVQVGGKWFEDSYAWIRNIKNDSDVLDLIEKENRFTDHQMRSTFSIQRQLRRSSQLFHEMHGFHSKNASFSIENFFEWGRFVYYSVQHTHLKHPKWMRQKVENCQPWNPRPFQDELVIDFSKFIPDHATYYAYGVLEISMNEKWVAFSIDFTGILLFF